MSSAPIVLDLNDVSAGKVELSTFPAKVEALDVAPYRDQHVQLSGCAPTWAHLLVAAKLLPLVRRLDFLIDDGKEGKVVRLI